MSIIHLDPCFENTWISNFVFFTDILKTTLTGQIILNSLLLYLWTVDTVLLVWQKSFSSF